MSSFKKGYKCIVIQRIINTLVFGKLNMINMKLPPIRNVYAAEKNR